MERMNMLGIVRRCKKEVMSPKFFLGLGQSEVIELTELFISDMKSGKVSEQFGENFKMLAGLYRVYKNGD